ncbi:hypothetical protein [Streptomyces canus]|uniref:hypothetical protein n=1 Tax=Streptomyces canus TaxID=58343 RepID=UPI0036E50E9E
MVSDPVFRRTVRAERTKTLTPRHLRQATARVEGKEEFQETCWLHVPGLPPSVLDPYLDTDPGQTPPTGTKGPGTPPGDTGATAVKDDATAPVRQRGKATGKSRLIQVGRDYNTGPEQQS